MRRASACFVGLCLLSSALPASAAGGGTMIVPEPMEGEKVRIDGDLREWPNKMTDLGTTLSGSGGRAGVTLGYDQTSLYVVLKIGDQRIVRTPAASETEDHATLLLAFPRGRDFNTYELE